MFLPLSSAGNPQEDNDQELAEELSYLHVCLFIPIIIIVFMIIIIIIIIIIIV